jgi:hypothetical protein
MSQPNKFSLECKHGEPSGIRTQDLVYTGWETTKREGENPSSPCLSPKLIVSEVGVYRKVEYERIRAKGGKVNIEGASGVWGFILLTQFGIGDISIQLFLSGSGIPAQISAHFTADVVNSRKSAVSSIAHDAAAQHEV